MTITTTTSKMTYTGSGITGPYTFTFKVFATSDLTVIKRTIATGAEETLTLTTDYTVSLDSSVPSAGSITLISTLSSSYQLIIRNDTPLTQATDYQANDVFPAETHESGLDKLTNICQRLSELIDRSIKVGSGETNPSDFVGITTGYVYTDGTTWSTQAAVVTTAEEYPGTLDAGADAAKAASPTVKDIYFATDTNILYRCSTAGTWTANYVIEMASGDAFTLKDSSGTTVATIDESGNLKIKGNVTTQGTF